MNTAEQYRQNIVYRAKMKGIEVPSWVPKDLHADYCDTAIEHGEEYAASRIRKMKRETAMSGAKAVLDDLIDALGRVSNVSDINARMNAYAEANIDLRDIKPNEFVEADKIAADTEMGRRVARS